MSSIRTVLGVSRRISSVCAFTHDQLFFRGVMLPGEGAQGGVGWNRWSAEIRATLPT